MPRATPEIIPCMSYHDANAMIAWLCKAFGFAEKVVYRGPDNGVAHAELTFGNGMIMLGSARDEGFGALQSTPRKLGGTSQSAYVIVDDVDAHHARAKAAGAEIVRPLEDTDHGSREYSARDPEGHLWNFGNYDPYKA